MKNNKLMSAKKLTVLVMSGVLAAGMGMSVFAAEMAPRDFGGPGMDASGFEQQERPELPEGELPEIPEGELPEISGEVPLLPSGEMPPRTEGEMPEIPDGEVPELPELPDGELPEMQNGERTELPPFAQDGQMQRFGRGMQGMPQMDREGPDSKNAEFGKVGRKLPDELTEKPAENSSDADTETVAESGDAEEAVGETAETSGDVTAENAPIDENMIQQFIDFLKGFLKKA
ncbi:MAG: hypothetical protein J6I56_04125 [Lachnospiraceae bacterium]|nr:hypothetical protein [Lachnospiraceae bacterium]